MGDSSDDGFPRGFDPLPGNGQKANSSSSTGGQIGNTAAQSSSSNFNCQVSQAATDSVLRHSKLNITLPWARQIVGFPCETGQFGLFSGMLIVLMTCSLFQDKRRSILAWLIRYRFKQYFGKQPRRAWCLFSVVFLESLGRRLNWRNDMKRYLE